MIPRVIRSLFSALLRKRIPSDVCLDGILTVKEHEEASLNIHIVDEDDGSVEASVWWTEMIEPGHYRSHKFGLQTWRSSDFSEEEAVAFVERWLFSKHLWPKEGEKI